MTHEIKHFAARDGADILYRKWKGVPEKDVIVYLHGIESHTEWFIDTADKLNQKGFSVYALERRGSGRSSSERGHMKDYWQLVSDLRRALEIVREENPKKKIYLMGLCWGGKLAVTEAALKHNMIDGLILVSPAIKTKINLPLTERIEVFFSNFLAPHRLFDVPITDDMFTKNAKYLEFIKNDKLKLTRATARFFFETARMDLRFNRIAGRIRVPLFLLLAGNDRIVDNKRTMKWFRREGSPDKTVKTYSGSCHSIEFEDESAELIEDITDWVFKHESKSNTY